MSSLRASKPLFLLLAFQPEICAFADASDCANLSSSSRWLRRAAVAHSNSSSAAAVPFPTDEELQHLSRYMLTRLATNARTNGAAATVGSGSRRKSKSGSKARLTAMQVRQLLRDLLLVSSGLRSSCLVDCCALSSEQAGCLLESLERHTDSPWKQYYGIANVRAVLLDGNVFFVNVASFILEKMVELAGGSREVQYVDVSASLAAPQIFQQTTDEGMEAGGWHPRLERLSCWTLQACEALLDALMPPTTRVLRLQRPSTLNATALAGILLCYPVVYDILVDDAEEADDAESGWDEQENCLAMCPLVVVQTAVRASDQTLMALQEFSVPQHLLVPARGRQAGVQGEDATTELPLARVLRASCATKLRRAIPKSFVDAGIQSQVVLSVRTLPRVAL